MIFPRLDYYDVLLLNSPSAPKKEVYSYKRTLPPLGLGYIATYLQHNGIRVGILDADYFGLGLAEIIRIIQDIRPAILGINCFTPCVAFCKQILEHLEDLSILKVVGGPHATASPTDFLMYRNTYVAVGFGEEAVYDICTKQMPLSDKIITNKMPKQSIIDTRLDYSFFHNHLIDNSDAQECVIISSRGCPYTCKFCLNYRETFMCRSMEAVFDEINFVNATYGIDRFHFLNDMAFQNNAQLSDFILCLSRLKQLNSFTWRGMLSIDILKKLDLNLLKRSGCKQVSLGMESGSDKILRLISKRHTVHDAYDVITRLGMHDITVKLFFLIGLPDEDLDDIQKTKQFIAEMKSYPHVTDINIFQYKPYPGTKLFIDFFTDVTVIFEYDNLLQYFSPANFENHRMVAALAKDNYFCEHPLLNISLAEVKETIIDMNNIFYC